jgi:hypothetical protein
MNLHQHGHINPLAGISFDYSSGRFDLNQPNTEVCLKTFIALKSSNAPKLPCLSQDPEINLACNNALIGLVADSNSQSSWLSDDISKLGLLGTNRLCKVLPEKKVYDCINNFIEFLKTPYLLAPQIALNAKPVLALAGIVTRSLLLGNRVCNQRDQEAEQILESFREIHPILSFIPESKGTSFHANQSGLRKMFFSLRPSELTAKVPHSNPRLRSYLEQSAIRIAILYLKARELENRSPDGDGTFAFAARLESSSLAHNLPKAA